MTNIDLNERPISFFNPMIKAVIKGIKSQTRMHLKVQPEWVEAEENSLSVSGWYYRDPFGKFELKGFQDEESFKQAFLTYETCPYGQVGDHLWIREEWKAGVWREDGYVAVDYKASPELVKTPWIEAGEDFEEYWIDWSIQLEKSGLEPDEKGHYHWEPGKNPLEWNRANSMPRWASRILLEITNIRLERLHNISQEDALAEGIDQSLLWEKQENGCLWPPKGKTLTNSHPTAVHAFAYLWASILGQEAWSSNPWVWVLDFKVIDGGTK